MHLGLRRFWLCGPTLHHRSFSALFSIQRLEQALLSLGFFEHGQLVERLQTQIIKKLTRGGKQRGPPHGFTVTDDLDPASVFQLLDDQAVHGHAANILDITPRDRLTVGDDGQRLQRRPRVLGRLLGVKLVQVDAHLGPALETPARSHLHQFHALEGPVLLQIQQQILNRVRAQHIIKK